MLTLELVFRGITVHPKQGFLFYSDWADKAACIGRALLDGSNHSIIVPTNNNKGQPQVRRSTHILACPIIMKE